jgi:N-acetylglucosaminyl-diphospho-decaprenol L-rhamnosyltransferase
VSSTAIIIVTYNSALEIGACLDAASLTGAEIVVVDNASTDATRTQVESRNVRLIANSQNRGFAAGVNQGIAAVSSPYVLLLNPDAVIQTSIQPLREACDLPGSAGAGGLLVDLAGRSQAGFVVRRLPTFASLSLEALLLNKLWPRNPANRRYRCLDMDLHSASKVEQPAGAFFMVRRAVWEELGGLDERFCPLWFEDVDFCARIKALGLSINYAPKAVAKHTGGHSITQLSVENRRIYWYRSLLRYSFKHFTRVEYRAVCLAVFGGAILRGLAESAYYFNGKPVVVNGRVAKLAVRCLIFGL